MSNVNIRRAIENIRAITNVYTPVVEMMVNAIQAIDESERPDGKVSVRAIRSTQTELDGSLSDISGFEIHDNGVGFTDEHRDSFDTLYTDRRINEGGKGFGRFTCLKYFEDLLVRSVYLQNAQFCFRTFSMGKDHEIIVREKITTSDATQSGTIVTLTGLKKGPTFDKKLSTIARNLVERLLPYFITQGYTCPEIVLSEQSGSDSIRLNDFVKNEISTYVREMRVDRTSFSLKGFQDEEEFSVRVFKLYSPRNQKSRISLVAHKREVSGSILQKYVPEFMDEFYERDTTGEEVRDRNYIVKAYVFGPYLDRHVSLERGGFEFAMENELLFGIAQVDIERVVAEVAQQAVGSDIALRQERKRERVHTYVDEEAPWLKTILRVRPETLCRITEFSEHESNGRELDEGERVAVEVLPVLGQSAAAVEPGDGAFDHPTPGLDDEALHPIGSLDDLGLEIGQDAGQGAVKDRPLIGAVGEQFPEKGKQTEQGRQQRETAVAILNVGGGDDAVQQQALRIDQNMPLLALDQLAGIEAVAVDASPPFSALFTL